jgi:hypothetical protein
MVNYDLPWNPTRLEQRMGRVHRYGQKYDVHIYNLVAKGTREGDVLGRILEKLEAMRAQLGSDRVYDVVGELLADVNLEKLLQDHLLGRKSLAEIQAMVDARLAPERITYFKEITLDSLAQRELDLSRLREQKRTSELQRLQPEYIERFFLKAFQRLGGNVEKRTDGLWRLRVPYELRQKRENIESSYAQVTFLPKKDAEFVAPGHPLFEAVIEQTMNDARTVLHQGAAFTLPQAQGEGLLGYLEFAVIDGQGKTVSRKLFASLQEGQGEATHVPSEVLVDALPNTDATITLAPEPARDAFRAWAHDSMLQAFLSEVRETRLREVEIRRKYGVRSLKYLLRESTKKLTQYRLKERKGEDMKLAILQEERRHKECEERLATLEAQLAKEASLNPEPAELVALAHVMPMSVQAFPDEDDPEIRRKVELAAMRVVMEYETKGGRTPVDVSRDNLGFDIRSEGRAIEVKGRAGIGAVVLTPNEWISAGRMGDEYYLYIVTQALTKPTLAIIQNPASKLSPDEEVSIVRYVISQADWQHASTMEEKQKLNITTP